MVDILAVVADKGDFITEIIVRQFGFIDTIAKCYLRQLTEYGYRGLTTAAMVCEFDGIWYSSDYKLNKTRSKY